LSFEAESLTEVSSIERQITVNKPGPHATTLPLNGILDRKILEELGNPDPNNEMNSLKNIITFYIKDFGELVDMLLQSIESSSSK
jgi:hypothetical protein